VREAGILGDASLTFAELDRQFAAGARIVTGHTGDGADAEVPLFAVTPTGRLSIGADGRPPDIGPEDTVIRLALAASVDGRRSVMPPSAPR
jgi:hypothetical protein